MGGHSAWRKRLKSGLLAKQGGGAICRHRPHLGRKGKEIEKNKKGNILGGPRKKKKNQKEAKIKHGDTEPNLKKSIMPDIKMRRNISIVIGFAFVIFLFNIKKIRSRKE